MISRSRHNPSSTIATLAMLALALACLFAHVAESDAHGPDQDCVLCLIVIAGALLICPATRLVAAAVPVGRQPLPVPAILSLHHISPSSPRAPPVPPVVEGLG